MTRLRSRGGAGPLSWRAALLIAVGLASFVSVGLWTALQTGVADTYDRRAGDLLWPRGQLDDRIVVVAIDAESIESVGQWPWPRSVQADLLEAVGGAGPALVVESVVLSPPSSEDSAIARAMGTVEGGVILAVAPLEVQSDLVADLLRVTEEASPGAVLAEVAVDRGHVLVLPDADGVVRSLPLAVEGPSRDLQPAVGLSAAARVDAGAAAVPLVLRPGVVEYGSVAAPVEDLQRLRVSWPTVPESSVLSAGNVLAGEVSAEDLAGRVVLIGVTDAATGGLLPAPGTAGQGAPGVLIQAAATHTLLTSSWVAVTPIPVTVGLCWALCLVLGVAVLRLPIVPASAVCLGAVVLAVLVPVALFEMMGWVPDVLRLAGAVVLAVLIAVLVRSLVEGRQRRLAVSLFSRYVPERVALDLVSRGRLDTVLSGQRVQVAVLFCDLRGFTPLAESLAPEDVRRVLNAYYDYTCERILANQGTVMQFVGDEVFAVFGAPAEVPDAAQVATTTAQTLQAERDRLHARLREAGLPPVDFGVSVHAGTVVAAHVGTDFRRQYAVIGDTVNLGSRLCGQARAAEVVVSREAAGATSVQSGRVEEVTVKGIDRPVQVVRWRPPAPSGDEAPSEVRS